MDTILKRIKVLSLITGVAVIVGLTSFHQDSKFKAIHISWLFTIIQDSKLVPLPQSIDVFYSKDYLIARVRKYDYNVVTKMKPGTDKVLDENVTIDSGYVYLVSKKGEKYGLAFDSLSMKTDKRVKIDVKTGSPIKMDVDSFVRSTLTAPAFFYSVKSKGLDSLIIEKDEVKGTLIEKYLNKRKEIQEPDSSYFYFTKKAMQYSFLVKNKRSDHMNLFKARAICNAVPAGTFNNANFAVKKYEHSFEIVDIDIPEPEITKIVALFKNVYDKIK